VFLIVPHLLDAIPLVNACLGEPLRSWALPKWSKWLSRWATLDSQRTPQKIKKLGTGDWELATVISYQLSVTSFQLSSTMLVLFTAAGTVDYP